MYLVMSQGTQIEASVWRDLADKYYDLLEEGKARPCSCTCLHHVGDACTHRQT